MVEGKVLFQSAFAGEWLKKDSSRFWTILLEFVSIRFRWRMAEEGGNVQIGNNTYEVSIRFRWRMAEEGSRDSWRANSVLVSIRFRWRMAEEG